MEDIYTQEGICKTTYDPSTKIVYVHWVTFSGHKHLRPSIEAQIECVKRGAKHVIVDSSDAKGLPSDEDQAWIGEHVFPIYAQHGLETLVTVLPKSAVTKLGANRWTSTSTGFAFKAITVGSTEDAYKVCAGTLAA